MTREEEILNQLVGLFGAADQQPKNTEVVFSKSQLDIAKEAEKRYLGRPEHQYYSAEDLARAFRDGAEWTEKHPQDVWHKAKEKPRIKEWVLIQFSGGDYGTMALDELGVETWSDWWCDNYKVRKWAYISDLMPKGGEK